MPLHDIFKKWYNILLQSHSSAENIDRILNIYISEIINISFLLQHLLLPKCQSLAIAGLQKQEKNERVLS